MKKSITLLLLVLLAVGLWTPGCSKSSNDSNAGGGAGSSVSFPEGPIELKIKWPVGNRYVQRIDLQQHSDMKLPQRPEPMKQDVTMGLEYAIAVMGENGAKGRELEMEFVAAEMDIVMGNRSIMNFDSGGETLDGAVNPLASLFDNMIGHKVRLFTNDDQDVERVEGLEELTRNIMKDAPPQSRGMMTNMFGRDIFKQMVELSKGMPDRPVQPGDTWNSTMEISMGAMGDMVMSVDYTFLDWQMKHDRACAHLEFSGTFSSGSENAIGPMGMTMSLEKGTAAGESWIDPELGMTVGGLVNQHMAMKMTAEIPKIGDKGGGTQVIDMVLNQVINTKLVNVETP